MATTPTQRTVRLVLVAGIIAGLSTYLVTPMERPVQIALASDVYRTAASAALSGEGLYGIYPEGRSGYGFLYPPIAVVPFILHALVPSASAAFVVQTVLNLLAAIGTALICTRALKRREIPVSRTDLGLLIGFMILSSYSAIQFMNGQINLWLAFAFAIGFDAIDREEGRLAGVAFAVAALFKVFPAIVGLWLLRLRAIPAVVAAVVTGVGGLVLGAMLFGPELTLTYLQDVLLGRFEGSTYEGRPDPTDNVDGVHRQLAAVWPDAGFAHTLIGLGLVGTLVASSLLRVETTVERDVAALGTIVGILLFLPLQPLYFPLITFPLLMLLYTLPARPERLLVIGATLLTFLHLDQDSVLLGLGWVPLPAGMEAAIAASTEQLFTFVLPPTLGLWLLLIACATLQVRTRIAPVRGAPTDTPPAPAAAVATRGVLGAIVGGKGSRSETDRDPESIN